MRASEQRARAKDKRAWEGVEAGGMPGSAGASAGRRQGKASPFWKVLRARELCLHWVLLASFVMMMLKGASSPQPGYVMSSHRGHANEEPFARGGTRWRRMQ